LVESAGEIIKLWKQLLEKFLIISLTNGDSKMKKKTTTGNRSRV